MRVPAKSEPPLDDPHATEGLPAGRRVNILLVDDQPKNLLTLEVILQDLGQNLVKAHSGRDALRHLLHEDFALILMDVQMPEMDGFETAALIRQRERSRDTPIIFLTAYDHTDADMFKGYTVGAVDFLFKPIRPEVLHYKVAVFVDIYRKTEQIKRQAELLRQAEQREHARQLAAAKERWEAERLAEEIRIARQIQQRLFPIAPLPLDGFDIGGASFPAEATGGDFFDYIPMLDGALGVVIGDVSGHGFGPALLMAETRAYLRALALTHRDVGEIVALVNQALIGDLVEDRFATLLLARLDRRQRSFLYTSAGHPTGFIFDSSGTVKTPLKSTGIPLGILPEGVFTAAPPIELQPGELIFLLTDGIVEACSAGQVLFGLDRALDTVRAHRDRSAHEIVHALYNTVRDYCRDRSQLDDMTAIVIKVGSAP
jgi:serine phosphatase RsbU (regulator of sigma subunit)